MLTFYFVYSESDRAIERYDEWLQLREQAIQNWESAHPSSPLPERLQEPPPPRPEPYEDEPMMDVSVDMTANGFDPSESFTLDRSIAEETVPVADPGVDRAPPLSVSLFFFSFSCGWMADPCSIADVADATLGTTRTGAFKSHPERGRDCTPFEEKISVAH